MAKTEVLHIRVEPDVKKAVEATLSQLGLSTSEAVNVFLRQVILKGGLPFDVRLPIYNDETIAAFEEAIKLSRSNDKSFTNTKDLFDELDQ